MPAITTRSERTGHWIKMRQSPVRFSALEASNRSQSLAGFITTTSESRFSVHTAIRSSSPRTISIPKTAFCSAACSAITPWRTALACQCARANRILDSLLRTLKRPRPRERAAWPKIRIFRRVIEAWPNGIEDEVAGEISARSKILRLSNARDLRLRMLAARLGNAG
jgi:hypothetical protein